METMPQHYPSPGEVRLTYERVIPHIIMLFEDFGITLAADEVADLAVYVRTMEVLDRHFDSIQDSAMLEEFSARVLRFCESGQGVQLRPELLRNLTECREIFMRRETLPQSCAILIELMQLGTRMRMMHDVREYISATLEEGHKIAELTELIFPRERITHALSLYMKHGIATINLVDNFTDADHDYLDGMLAIQPSLAFRATIQATLLFRVSVDVARHPNKARVSTYVARLRSRLLK